MARSEKNTDTNVAKSALGMVFFVLFIVGGFITALYVPLLITEMGEPRYLNVLSFWVVALLFTVVCFRLSRRLRGGAVPQETLILQAPWLLSNESATQYAEVRFNPDSGISFVAEKGGKDVRISFDSIKYIRHSYNLRLPAIYIHMKDSQKYALAFIVSASDVKSIQKSLIGVALIGEAAVLAGSDTAMSSSYGQIKPGKDVIGSIYIWFKKYNPKLYKNIVSRNALMAIIMFAMLPAVMAVGIAIESILK